MGRKRTHYVSVSRSTVIAHVTSSGLSSFRILSFVVSAQVGLIYVAQIGPGRREVASTCTLHLQTVSTKAHTILVN